MKKATTKTARRPSTKAVKPAAKSAAKLVATTSDAPRVSFRARLQGNDKTAAGMEVPPDVVARLGTSKRPPVRVTINRHTYRSSVAVMDGKFMLGVSVENRAKAGVAAGEMIDVELQLDMEPREVTLPPDFSAALDRSAKARQFFDQLSYSQRRWFVEGIESAKAAETRQRRIDAAVSRLRAGRGQL